MKEYQENLRNLSLKESYSKEDLLSKEFLYAKDGKVEVYWAPFDYINKKAKVIILGITPGFTQMEMAFNYVRRHINEVDYEYEKVFCDAKKQASFGGTVMRRNLIEMLDGIGLQELLHIPSCDQLFNKKHDLLHTTSVLRYPVFIEGENYGGSNPKILSNEIFLRMIDGLLVPELNSLKDAVIIPTGKAVSDVLKNLVDEGKIQNDNILFNFPHPSGANGHRKEQYETNKHLFKEQLAKLAASEVVKEDHMPFIPTTGSGEMAELIKQLKIIGEELKRSNDLKERGFFYEKRLPQIADEIEPYDHRIALVIDHLLGK